MNSLVWFITGTSRGLGLAITRAALERGDVVVAAARNAQSVENAVQGQERMLALDLDVTNVSQAQTAVSTALQRFGRIDVLVNNAGRGLLGAVEEASAEEVRSLFAVNVDGLLTVTRAVLPSMRQQRSGHIMNMSSGGGMSAAQGWGVYCATKFAVEGLSESLHAELRPLGIHVTILEPGAFRTDFLDVSSLHRTAEVIDDYNGTAGVTRRQVEVKNHDQPGDPAKAAAAIIAIATTAEPPLRMQLGTDCVARVERKLSQVATELAKWRSLAESTDYDKAVQGSAA